MENTSKKSNPRLKLIISIMIIAALFLAELYVMINQSNSIVLVIGIAVLILIALYFAIDAILNCVNEKDSQAREQYDKIYRSEKASYMLLKKNFEEFSKKIETINQETGKAEVDLSEITKSQKAIAKVAMNKNKDTQDRLFIELNNLEASLNDSVRGISEKLSGFQEEIERLADHIARINEEAILTASKNSQDIRTIVTEQETVGIADIEESIFEESILEDSIIDDVISEENLVDEIILDTDINGTGDVEEKLEFESIDFNELDLDVSFQVESDNDVLSQLLAAEEVSVEEEEIDVLAELTKAEEEVLAPTSAPADNGGKMNQDDIAALIASMTGGDVAPTTEPEPAPVPTPAPADNGGKMNQDDIAALIASMTGN